MRITRAVTLGLICGLPGSIAADELIGDRIEGRAFARDVCADCHHVEAEEPAFLLADVLTFSEIASLPRTTELSLRVFLQTPHLNMPDFILDRDQTDNVIAYILSLRDPAD